MIAALISTLKAARRWRLILLIAGLVIGFGTGMLISARVTDGNDYYCRGAKITSPLGAPANRRSDAAAFPISSPVEIKWDRTDCVMTIEYFQENQLGDKYWDIMSGTAINVGAPNSGETEIKLWRKGAREPSDSIWVWVK
jgi:hypothetical protein